MKKILPKSITTAISAEDLEASFQKSSTSISKNQTAIVEPSVVEKVLNTTQIINSQNLEEGTAPKPAISSKRDGRSRISIDIPDELFAKIEMHKDESGQTMTHLVVSLLKKFFAEKKTTI
jgi:hypothetical protein